MIPSVEKPHQYWVCIYGFNITLLAGLLAGLSARLFGRWRGAILAGLGIALYTALTGGQPSVVRSAIIGGLGCWRSIWEGGKMD